MVSRPPTPSVPRIDRRRPLRTQIWGARALPHVRAGPPLPPGPSLPPQHPPSARKEDTSAPSPLSAPPRSRGKSAHEGTSPRPLPAGARRTARPPQSPSAQATPAQPHAPRPAPPAYARGGTVRPPLRAGHASPTPRAPPCPRTQEDGRRVQPRPAHGRKERDGAPTPPRGPRQPSRPHTQGGGSARPPPPHGLRQPGVYARRHARALSGMQEGRVTLRQRHAASTTTQRHDAAPRHHDTNAVRCYTDAAPWPYNTDAMHWACDTGVAPRCYDTDAGGWACDTDIAPQHYDTDTASWACDTDTARSACDIDIHAAALRLS
ncbi:hypothetical protein EDB85DRAFT_2290176 [Lactarius pseudohatsudake]|nr:hypothetical protein EDB85DRAFT_2290176 [Lactarius pseudohatsudake]